MAQCRSCKQNIQWVTTSTGKMMPVELAKEGEGNIVLNDGAVQAQIVKKGEGTHVSHFATCPKADFHRRVQARKTTTGGA